MIKKIIGALFIGLCATIVQMQHDPWIKESVGIYVVRMIEQLGNCAVCGTVKEINIFTPSLTMTNVEVTPCNGTQWRWSVQEMKAGCSWLHLLCFGSIDINIELHGYTAHTNLNNGTLAIMEHINALMYAPVNDDIPTFVKSVHIRHAQFTVSDSDNDTHCMVQWHSDSKKIEQMFKSNVSILDGSVSCGGINYLDTLQGSVFVDTFVTDALIDVFARVNSSFNLSQLSDDAKKCYFSGVWDHDHGSCVLKNEDQSIVIDPVTVTKSGNGVDVNAQLTVPVEYMWRFANHKSSDVMVGGTAQAAVNAHVDAGGIVHTSGSVAVKNPRYSSFNVCDNLVCSFSKNAMRWEGDCSLVREALRIDGLWHWDEDANSGSVHLANKTVVDVPYVAGWHIMPDKAVIDLAFDNSKNCVTADYVFEAYSQDDAVTGKGRFSLTPETCSIIGMLNDRNYRFIADLQPVFALKACEYVDKDGQSLFTLNTVSDAAHTFVGSITMPLMRHVSRTAFGYEMQGEGTFDLRVVAGDTINTHIHLANGTMRLPHTYNFINGFDADVAVDIDRQKVMVTDLACTLHKGSLQCARAVFGFNNDGKLVFAHAPFLLTSCLFNFDKDLFMMVSGRSLFIKKGDNLPLLKSRLIIEHAQLKENLFSAAFQRNIFKLASSFSEMKGADMLCDIKVDTRSPIYINIPFFEAYATVGLHVKNSIHAPEISGAINLKSGVLNFPYKPLYITKGSLYFTPQQPTDPIIELVAKNNIRKYNITMRVNGSVSNPHVSLESAPPLTEEQIIALLLVGSQEESLNIVMPALIMQNITSLIFGSESSSLNLSRYFKTLLEPFKNVRLVPSFTDQTGRGGLRGALEIDVNERWRALIQKNFSLSEDTRFELEYLVSDDISLRAIRDERRDVGGEVEMRWKF